MGSGSSYESGIRSLYNTVQDYVERFDDLRQTIDIMLSGEASRRRTALAKDQSRCHLKMERDFLEGFYLNGIKHAETYFPIIIRNSLFVNIMGVAESSAIDLARLNNNDNQPYEDSLKRKESAIDHALDFSISSLKLSKARAFHLHEIRKSFADYQKIRNCIQHSEGYLRKVEPNRANQLRLIMDTMPAIISYENDLIRVLDPCIKLLLSNWRVFFHNYYHFANTRPE